MTRTHSAGPIAALFAALGCHSAHAPATSPSSPDADHDPVVITTDFEEALEAFAAVDQSGKWTLEQCRSIGKRFADLAERAARSPGTPMPEGHYNAALAFERCGLEEQADRHFRLSRSAPDFRNAALRLAIRKATRRGDLAGAIEDVAALVRSERFQNPQTLVVLAALQMEHAGGPSNEDAAADLARAHENLQRALAIDDGHVPAKNQLALYYLRRAMRSAGADVAQPRSALVRDGQPTAHLDRQQVDLAALVVSQALATAPTYAPLHNTAGLAKWLLGDHGAALASFGRARTLDPGLIEAHANFAALSLSFRSFARAEEAYRAVLAMDPNDHAALVGLAVALRGQMTADRADPRGREAHALLARARKLRPERPEADFNEARLLEQVDARANGDVSALRSARDLYQDFVRKAGDDPAYAEAVKEARERHDDLGQIIDFADQGTQP